MWSETLEKTKPGPLWRVFSMGVVSAAAPFSEYFSAKTEGRRQLGRQLRSPNLGGLLRSSRSVQHPARRPACPSIGRTLSDSGWHAAGFHKSGADRGPAAVSSAAALVPAHQIQKAVDNAILRAAALQG